MKAVLGWLNDPYIHLFAVGLVLATLTMAYGDDEAVEVAAPPVNCRVCREMHACAHLHPPVVASPEDATWAD